MATKTQNEVEVTNKYTIDSRKQENAIPVFKSEWSHLRESISRISNGSRWWEIVFSVAIATFLTAASLYLSLPTATRGRANYGWISLILLAMAIMALAALVSSKKGATATKEDVLSEMDDIEEKIPGMERESKILFEGLEIKGIQLPKEVFSGADDLFEDAARASLRSGKASASMLQRRLRIGYARAARLLDELEKYNIVGASDGANPREVLVHKSDRLDEIILNYKKDHGV